MMLASIKNMKNAEQSKSSDPQRSSLNGNEYPYNAETAYCQRQIPNNLPAIDRDSYSSILSKERPILGNHPKARIS